jgi:hypothetical protein
MVDANSVAGMAVSFCMVNPSIVTVTYIVTHQAALVFRAIVGVTHFAVFIPGDAAATAADIITNGGAYEPTSGSRMAAAMTQFVANGGANQTTDNRAAEGIATATLTISDSFHATGIHRDIHRHSAINRVGSDYRSIGNFSLINDNTLMLTMVVVMFVMMFVAVAMMVTRLSEAAQYQAKADKANSKQGGFNVGVHANCPRLDAHYQQ